MDSTKRRAPKRGIRQEGLRWRAEVSQTRPVKRRATRRFATAKAAQAWRARALLEVAQGTFRWEDVEDADEPTFREWVEEFRRSDAWADNKYSEQRSKESILKYHLVPAFGDLPLSAITTDSVGGYAAAKLKGGRVESQNAPKAMRGKGLSKKTVNNHLTVLRKCLDMAVPKWLDHPPRIRWLKVSKPAFDYLSFEEADRVKAGADAEWRGMVATAAETGLRLGELRALRWAQLDLAQGVLHVTRTIWRGVEGPPKSGRSRTIPLLANTVAVLKTHRSVVGLRSEYVFSRSDGSPLTEGDCKWPLRRALKRASIVRAVGRIGWHDLRHTFGTHLALKGADAVQIQELMGHATLEQTRKYIHVAGEAKRRAIQVLEKPHPLGL